MSQTQRMIDWLLATARKLDDETRLGSKPHRPELKGCIWIELEDATAKEISAGLREAAASFTPEEEPPCITSTLFVCNKDGMNVELSKAQAQKVWAEVERLRREGE